ncbi:MAG: DUF2254 domain-containing protein [Ilumatobacteraceae bacterium]
MHHTATKDTATKESTAEQASGWVGRHVGVVRLRQLSDRVRHRLSFIPTLYVVGAIVLVQALLLVDRGLTDEVLPTWLETTVDSARSVFSTIAGGLITSITLLLSMMLVAVQLASTQFSPRTLRDWLGNRTLQRAIGLVLGTTVYCLLALRSTRDFGEGADATVPHVTVLVAVALGVLSLVAVVRSVDHLTQSVRVGSVAERVATETIEVIGRTENMPPGQAPELLPASAATVVTDRVEVPPDAVPIETTNTGWIQQIDADGLLSALPEGSTGFVAVSIGGFVPDHAPLLWIAPPPHADDPCRERVLDAFAIGDSRTMQQDVEFGLVQLTDVAVRALSPGVNDPTTACDVIVHIGNVLVSIWEQDEPASSRSSEGRTVVMVRVTHAAYLDRAFGPIRRYGAADPEVMVTLLRTIALVRSEAVRRDLPGPLEPLDALTAATLATADTSTWSETEIERFEQTSRS